MYGHSVQIVLIGLIVLIENPHREIMCEKIEEKRKTHTHTHTPIS